MNFRILEYKDEKLEGKISFDEKEKGILGIFYESFGKNFNLKKTTPII